MSAPASPTRTNRNATFAEAVPRNSLIAFSVKANGNLAVLKTLGDLGAGADVVSGGELKKARAALRPGGVVARGGRREQQATRWCPPSSRCRS